MSIISVICNNRDKEWCPYGTEDCRCHCHEPYELQNKDDAVFTCTDINYCSRNCYAQDYTEFLLQKELKESGYKRKVMNAICNMINAEITPEVYEHYYGMVKGERN